MCGDLEGSTPTVGKREHRVDRTLAPIHIPGLRPRTQDTLS
jgi:hypothetical protein